MQTNFSLAQLADPNIAEADSILRRCVHCGFCLATCPTYLELGNELDSPRGRIYLIKDMLENDKPASSEVATPYRPLPLLPLLRDDLPLRRRLHAPRRPGARAHREDVPAPAARPAGARRSSRAMLPYADRFRARRCPGAARAGRSCRMLRAVRPGRRAARAMLRLAPESAAAQDGMRPGVSFTPRGQAPRAAWRCSTAARRPCSIPGSTVADSPAAEPLRRRGGAAEGRRLLRRDRPPHGPRAPGAPRSRAPTSTHGSREIDGEGLDAILVTTSGCGTTIKDYGHMFRLDPAYAEKAARVSALALDVTEYLARLDLPAGKRGADLIVAYHSACSLQHGQRITTLPKALLKNAGFEVRDIPEGHICCGSAGTYNILQPEIAARLRDRKVAQHRDGRAGRHRHRQHRLHHADRVRHDRPDRAHGRAARLGLWRRAPGGASASTGRATSQAPNTADGRRRRPPPPMPLVYRASGLQAMRSGGLDDGAGSVGGLQVARVLYDSSTTRRCPGPAIAPGAYSGPGSTASSTISRRKNRALLEKRDRLQAEIDAWHRERRGHALRSRRIQGLPAARSATCCPRAPTSRSSTANVDPEIADDRRAAARRAGDERALRAERRQCALGQPLRRALRHGCDPRGRRGGRAARATIPSAAKRSSTLPAACSTRRRRSTARSWKDATALRVAGGRARRSTLGDGSDRACATASSFAGYQGARTRPRRSCCSNHGLHLEIRVDRNHPIGKRRSGRHRRRRRGIGDDDDHGLRGFDRRRRCRGQGRRPIATGSA